MWSAALTEANQILEIKFAKHVDAAQASTCAEKVKSLLPRTSPGFCLLNDLSQLERMDLACEPFITQLMDTLNQHGIHKVVRIVPEPDKDIGFGIMSLFHYGHNVRTVTCQTLEEARTHLPVQVR